MTALSILLVDDDANTLLALAGLLRSEGHTVACCASAEEALEQLAASPFDVLLTDQVMSGMSGVDLTRAALARFPTLRCFVLSGHKTPLDARPDVGWIAKPIDVDVLLTAIARRDA